MRRLLAALLLACAACQGSPAAPARTTTTVVEQVVTPTGEHREVTEVDRPYRARTRVYAASGDVTGGFAWTEDGVFTLKGSGPQRSQDVPPGRPGPDSYLAVALPVAEQAGLVRRDGTSSVLGRACTWWLSRLPLSSVPLSPPGGGDETRSCVDGSGLVLTSVERAGGRQVSTRTVTSITRTAPLTDRELFGGPAPTGGAGLVKVKQLDVPPAPPLALAAVAPSGFAFSRGSVAAALTGPGGDVRVASDRAVYVRDGRLAVLDESQDRLQRPVLDTGEVVEVGTLGQGRLTSGFDGLTLRALTADGVLVTLTGWLTREEILAWGASLRAG